MSDTNVFPLAGVKGQSLARVVVVTGAVDIGDGTQRQRGIPLARLVQVYNGYTATIKHSMTGEDVEVDFSHLKDLDHTQTMVTLECRFQADNPLDPHYQLAARTLFPKGIQAHTRR